MWQNYQNEPKLSDTALANLEALAGEGETEGNGTAGPVEFGQCAGSYFWGGLIARECGSTVVICKGKAEEGCSGRRCPDHPDAGIKKNY